MAWHVYLIECRDGSIYTGIAIDVAKRFVAHATGKGAKYTCRRGAKEIVWSEPADSKSAALIREYALKQLTRAEKFALARR